MVQKMEGKVVEMFSDSRLVVGQVKGEMKARDMRMPAAKFQPIQLVTHL